MRFTLSLDEELDALLRMEARRRGVSAAAVAREALASYLQRPGEGRRGGRRHLPFAALGHSGHADTAERAEELLREAWRPEDDAGGR